MKVAIGLPTTIPGVQGHELTEWARRADAAGFSSLGTLDRMVYPNYESLVALGAAAAVTERIALITAIAILPMRQNAALAAKQAATLQHQSGGRFVFGVAPGGRPDDFEAGGVPFEDRGRRFEVMLDDMKRIWAGEERGDAGPIGPDVSSNPPTLIVGGQIDAAFRRAARYGEGWIAGGGDPEYNLPAVEKLEAAWREAGREGEPRKLSLTYFSLDDDPEEQTRRSNRPLLRVRRGVCGPRGRRHGEGRGRRKGEGARLRGGALRRANHVPCLLQPGAGGPAGGRGALGRRHGPEPRPGPAGGSSRVRRSVGYGKGRSNVSARRGREAIRVAEERGWLGRDPPS
jgi:alkanesulfonate monooxygenase SsuD/methylene tetrahydromethanopterin reductase-like flavin-dependent oxidoreductase (luciferase family)